MTILVKIVVKERIALLNQKMKSKINIHVIYSIILVLVSSIMLGMNFLPNNIIDPFNDSSNVTNSGLSAINKKQSTAKFDQKLATNIQNIDNLVFYVRQHVKDKRDKYQLMEKLTCVINKRFVHAYSVYDMDEDWLAVLAGRFIWRDLSAKVIPDDILKDPVAACNQVSIVLMSALEKLGITTRKVGLVGHYTLEAFVNDKWYFIDADLEPNFKAINGRKSLEEILKNKEQFALYANTILDSQEIEKKFSSVTYDQPNIEPAPRASLFHLCTKFLSHWGWVMPLILAIYTYLCYYKAK